MVEVAKVQKKVKSEKRKVKKLYLCTRNESGDHRFYPRSC